MALPACTIEIRTGGSDTNGGGFVIGGTGTDYSQQDLYAAAIGDLSCNVASTTLTCEDWRFTEAMEDNLIYISGGTNFTTGWYRIVTYTDTNNVVLDRTACDGVGNATEGSSVVGGALASPGSAAKLMNDNAIAGHKVHQEAGDYLLTTTSANVSGGVVALNANMAGKLCFWCGYNTTREDWGVPPKINCNGQSGITVFDLDGGWLNNQHICNIEIDGDGQDVIAVAGDNTSYDYATGILADNCDNASSVFYKLSPCMCRASNCAGTGFRDCAMPTYCWSVKNGIGFNAALGASHCTASENTGNGFTGCLRYVYSNLTAYGNGGDGFSASGGGTYVNNISAKNGIYGYDMAADSVLINCGDYDNTSGRIDGTDYAADILPFTITDGDPFILTDQVDPLDDDFRPNAMALRGALLRAAGIGVRGQSSSHDVGALQHTDPSGPHIIGG